MPADQRAPEGLKLKERAFRELRLLLLSGEFPVGALISERQLVARMQMSKTPIRVALERLERDGFVEILPQRGIRVRVLDEKEIADLFDLRIALESWVVERLARARTEPDWRPIDDCLAAQRAAVDAGDLDRYAREDAEFHDRLSVLAGNDEVVRIMRLQRERLTRIIRRIHERDRERPGFVLEEHVGIVDALRRRDADLAVTRMRDHLRWGRRFLLGTGDGPPPERAAPQIPDWPS